MSRQKTKVNSSVDNGKTPSFKVSGVIVLCVLGFMLFGFTPEASAGDISSTEILTINILTPICEVMDMIGQALPQII
jgi:hypothetical protein